MKTIDLQRLKEMDGYTFDEGVSVLRLLGTPNGVIRHIVSTHNRSHLHSEIHKLLRMPGAMRMLKEKGYLPEKAPETAENVPEPGENGRKNEETVPPTDENEPVTPDQEPNGNITKPADDESEDNDPTEIILTREDVRTHKYTRYDQMPNDLTRKLYLKKDDLYHEMQQNHLKMRNVPEGEEHDGERAHFRAEVLRLDEEVEKTWALIDEEIERFLAEGEKPDKNEGTGTDFNVSTYRSYISRAVRKKSLTPEQFVELQHRVDAMIAANEELSPETIAGLKAKGIVFTE